MLRVASAGGDVFGVIDQNGLTTSLLQYKKDFEMQKNLSALPLLGRTVLEEQQLLAQVRSFLYWRERTGNREFACGQDLNLFLQFKIVFILYFCR